MHPIESALYKITTVGQARELVISLENGNPRGNLVVEGPNQNEQVLYQKWAVVHQSDGIYTFRSPIEKFEDREIQDSKKPYARNHEDDSSDHYIRGGAIDVFTTYRIRRVGLLPNTFTIRLPGERKRAWTIAGDNRNIILNDYDTSGFNQGQLWKFEKIGDLPHHDDATL